MKYHNHRIETQDGKFDSEKEFRRWQELKLLERAGKISNLRRQVTYTLVPSQKTEDGTLRAVKYIADFVYTKNGSEFVEDAKGVKTPEYVIKKKLMKYLLNITVKES